MGGYSGMGSKNCLRRWYYSVPGQPVYRSTPSLAKRNIS
ncbi:MAG: hypothetical protein E7C07_06945 [Enterobacter sp.]|nr:hypothetical protein [Enterobacter sp.]